MTNRVDGSSRKQKIIGVLFSYALIFVNAFSNLVSYPIVKNCLSTSDLGIYQTIMSFYGYFAILEFGTVTIITKFLTQYSISDSSGRDAKRFLFYMMLQTGACAAIAFVGALGIAFLFPNIFQKFTAQEAALGSRCTLFFAFDIVLTFVNHYFIGVLNAKSNFIVKNGVLLLQAVAKILIVIVSCQLKLPLHAIFGSQILLSLVCLVFNTCFCLFHLKIRVMVCKPQRTMVKTVIFFSLSMFLQTLINSINSGMDKTIIGVMMGSTYVTIYTAGAVVFTMMDSLSSSINSVVLPEICEKVTKKRPDKELTDVTIKVGRFVFAIVGLVFVGFTLYGKEFMYCWMGNGYETSYYLALILMSFSMFDVVTNVNVSITLAKGLQNKRLLIISVTTAINLALTIVLIKFVGVLGASIGTAISYLLGYIIGLNIFYKKSFGWKPISSYIKIFGKTFFVLLFVAALGYGFKFLLPFGSWVSLILKCVLLTLVYLPLEHMFGIPDLVNPILQSRHSRLGIIIQRKTSKIVVLSYVFILCISAVAPGSNRFIGRAVGKIYFSCDIERGRINGSLEQVGLAGEPYEPVTLAVNPGYAFARWSDGTTDVIKKGVFPTGSQQISAEINYASGKLLSTNLVFSGSVSDEPTEVVMKYSDGRVENKAIRTALSFSNHQKGRKKDYWLTQGGFLTEVLLSGNFDQTVLRNALGYCFFEPENVAENMHLYLNGSYVGLYTKVILAKPIDLDNSFVIMQYTNNSEVSGSNTFIASLGDLSFDEANNTYTKILSGDLSETEMENLALLYAQSYMVGNPACYLDPLIVTISEKGISVSSIFDFSLAFGNYKWGSYGTTDSVVSHSVVFKKISQNAYFLAKFEKNKLLFDIKSSVALTALRKLEEERRSEIEIEQTIWPVIKYFTTPDGINNDYESYLVYLREWVRTRFK